MFDSEHERRSQKPISGNPVFLLLRKCKIQCGVNRDTLPSEYNIYMWEARWPHG